MRLILFFTMFALPFAGFAEVRLPKILSSHAVLQRDQPIHIWGWSQPGEQVSVTLQTASATTTGDRSGTWSVYLPAQPAGGPFQLTVTGTNKIVLDDILMGDVWFASGQSNMEMPLMGFPGSAVVNNAAEEIRNANRPDLRLLLIPRNASQFPLSDFQGEAAWTACTPETAAKFSAVAYFFGREIASKEHVSVGLIDSTWGGTPAEAWVSLEGLASDSALMPVFASFAKMANDRAEAQAILAAEKREDEAARRANQPPPHHPWHPALESYDPSWLYNAMVAPATQLGIKGVIWYQGETNSNLERAPLYHQLFSKLIADWRGHWKQGDFPFLFTQISSFKSNETEGWAIVRDAQRRTLSVANTGMAVTIDIGDPDNVHPPDKQTVGMRLALAARALGYDERIEYSGPLFREAVTEGAAMRVLFSHAAGGLAAKGGELQGFEIAGEDHRFISAAARIDGQTVVVTGTDVSSPKYVRYAWQDPLQANLYNAADLPASPFVSE
jgi:sialate O-acetylesterase